MQKVSIIIPTYNRAHLIGETLDSILSQTYRNWECIVIDDGSTDYTNELLEFYCIKDKRFRYYQRPKKYFKGANACRNYGFELSRGEYVNWFDSDDLMSSIFLEDGIHHFSLNPHLDLTISDYKIFSDKENRVTHVQRNQINNLFIDYITGKINFGCPCVIWNKNILKGYKYDENLSRAQELDFHFNILSTKEVVFKHLSGEYLSFRRHNKSLTSNFNEGQYKSLQSELKVRRRILVFLFSQKYEKNVLNAALKIYLSTFRKLSKNYSLQKTVRELKRLKAFICFNSKYPIWAFYFFLYLITFKLTKREYRLKLHIPKLIQTFDAPK